MPIDQLLPASGMTFFANHFFGHHRGIDSLRFSPSVHCDARPKSGKRNVYLATPFCNGARMSVMGDSSIVRTIRALRVACGPSYIAFFVVPIIVDAIKAHAVRAMAEMRKKFREGFEFHSYASTAVAEIISTVLVVAPRLGIEPSGVLAGRPCSWFSTVRFIHKGL